MMLVMPHKDADQQREVQPQDGMSTKVSTPMMRESMILPTKKPVKFSLV